MTVGGTQGGQVPGPALVSPALCSSRESRLPRAHTWVVKPRRAQAPGSFPGTFSIPSAPELPRLTLGAEAEPVAGSGGAVRGAGLPARCCSAATRAFLCFVPQRQWQFGIHGVRTPGLAAAPCCLEELSASFPPSLLISFPFVSLSLLLFGFETLCDLQGNHGASHPSPVFTVPLFLKPFLEQKLPPGLCSQPRRSCHLVGPAVCPPV